MKINERMRYPHPVLSEYSSDYSSGQMSAKFHYQQTDDNQLKVISDISIENDELSAAVSSQNAASGYFLVSRRTYFNHLQEAPPGESEKFFDLSQLHGLVTIRPVVWTLSNLDGFSSPLIDSEFGEEISIGKGSIIAMGPEYRFSIDPRKFKPFETIFKLAIDDAVPPGMIEVDTDDSKINILAETETHAALANMRNIGSARAVLLSSVYMPVIADIVASLRADGTNFEAKRWFQVFSAKCDDLGIRPEDPSISPLRVAQMLLKAPLRQTAKAMEAA